jgi:hypothetical protein
MIIRQRGRREQSVCGIVSMGWEFFEIVVLALLRALIGMMGASFEWGGRDVVARE